MPLIPPFTHISAVVFDFDGTLARLTLNFGEMNAAVERAVRAIYPDAPKFAPPALEWVAACALSLRNKQPELARRVTERAEAAMIEVEVAAATRGELFPQTRPLLNNLRQRQISCGVVTRNCRPAVLTVFPDLESVCPLLTREDTARPKPDPAHLLEMLALLKAAPEEALMVGDHPMDILTGQRAGTMTCGVTGGHCTAEQLRSAGPDLIVPNCGDLFSSALT